MNMAENTVWAIMAGGLLSLVMLTAADTLVTRSIGAMRNLLLIGTISSVCIVLSGLPEVLFPHLPQRLGMLITAGLGPLGGALGLRLLGIWIGGAREDRIVNSLTVWGCFALLISSLVLMVLAMLVTPTDYPQVLTLTAVATSTAAVLTLLVAVRATLLGDPLGRWLVLACLILMGLTAGLHLRALKVPGFGLWTWIFTASCAVVFVLIVMVLVIERNRHLRRLARLARLETGRDPVTGLATGSKLLFEVEHVFWRTARLRGKCVVVCVYLSNLYELGDAAGRAIDNQILAATAARIRRAGGFRCLVGMYHPRCFIIVVSTDMKRKVDEPLIRQGFMDQVAQPLAVIDSQDRQLEFVPQVGLSVLTALPDSADPRAVINEAERLAMELARQQPTAHGERADTVR